MQLHLHKSMDIDMGLIHESRIDFHIPFIGIAHETPVIQLYRITVTTSIISVLFHERIYCAVIKTFY